MGNPVNILVAEDNNIQRMAILQILGSVRFPYQAWEAGNDRQALALMCERDFDIVLTDIRMPFIDGIALAKEISLNFPHIRTIFITSYPEFDYAQKAISLGVADYVLKPVEERRLIEVVERAECDIRRAQSEINCARYALEYILWKGLDGGLSQKETRLLEGYMNASRYRLMLVESQSQLFYAKQSEAMKRVSGVAKRSLCVSLNEYQLAILLDDSNEAASACAGLFSADNELSVARSEVFDSLGQLRPIIRKLENCRDEAQLTESAGEARNASISPRIRQAISFIGEHYASDICLTLLAEKLNMSSAYLCTLFKKETGVSYVQYITKLRMRHAKELLCDPSIKISDIAARVGYFSSAYFSTLFRNIEGVSPAKYRSALEE